MASLTVLVTGATGYVGGRLVPELLDHGHHVRCLARTPAKLELAPWYHSVDVVAGDVGGDLTAAMHGVNVAVYLVHSIGASPDWAEREVRDAENFRRACERAGVQRIIYLGGMGDDRSDLSTHLRSRHDVGKILAAGPIPVIELRAAVIIGSGSASFEMLRYLVEVLPVMVTPKWVRTLSQPIAISDVLTYLVAAIERDDVPAGIYEIGGPDVVSYAEMMDLYAEEAGLRKRRLIPVPFLTPRLSSHWVGLVTPVPADLARPLVDSLVNEVVVASDRTTATFGPPTRTLREAIHLALGRIATNSVPTTFSDANIRPFGVAPTDPRWAGGTVLRDERTRVSSASAERVFRAVSRIGGDRGWYSGMWLWRLRGVLDQVWGGPGLRRGRRDPDVMHVGDYVDFWRVEEVREDSFIRLHAEMRLPGEAWLEWRIEPLHNGGSVIVQTARFQPRGLLGRMYWYAVAPFHGLVFPNMLRGVTTDAERL